MMERTEWEIWHFEDSLFCEWSRDSEPTERQRYFKSILDCNQLREQ